MDHIIKVKDNKVEVVYTNMAAGCIGSGMFIMTLTGLFILFMVVPHSSMVRGFFGILIGIPCTLFFLTKLLQVLSALLRGKVLFTIENGYIKGRKNSVAINEIKDMYLGGLSFKILHVRTTQNKIIKFNTFNLVSDNAINLVINNHVIPKATPELKANWEKRQREKSA
ncbi:DUF5381 family protein [Neobacillus kokaensis]|uniref:DUF304 domain-containing protein n=1 Tax=Neobacillus kokaensis TaxID=2759023 RepID=A0ABQ3N4J1_9BACI|nr:DUF5381 family protein [Neobacillus kokaensis]GHH99839.1 hypothetical protein AM1BK_33820 [Neobacillus kokaensis]